MQGAGKKGPTAEKGNPTTWLECHGCGETHFARDCPNPDLRIAGQGKGQRSVYADIANANREAKGGKQGYGEKGSNACTSVVSVSMLPAPGPAGLKHCREVCSRGSDKCPGHLGPPQYGQAPPCGVGVGRAA